MYNINRIINLSQLAEQFDETEPTTSWHLLVIFIEQYKYLVKQY